VLELLNSFQIPHAVVGAFAVSYHGVPRATSDGDSVIWMKDTGKTAEELEHHLLAAGYRVKLKQGDLDDPIMQSLVIEDQFENRVDLLSGVRGMDPDAVKRSVPMQMLDLTVPVIAAEDLIGMKIFAGGAQDMIDARGILEVSREHLNPDLLRRVARRYGSSVAHTLDKLLKEFPLTDP
jgi:hypothetical protein